MEKSITELPKEVLFDIFEKITEADDRRSLALVCKCFYEIIRRQSANYSKISIDSPAHDILSIFANCHIFPFRTLHLKKILYFDFAENQENWIFAGQTIKTLIMDSSLRTDDWPEFLHAIKTFFPKLEELRISDYDDDDDFEAPHSPEEYRNDSVEKLQLVKGANFSIAEVNFLLRCYPNLKILDLFINFPMLRRPELAEIVSNWCSQVAERVILDISTQFLSIIPELSNIARLHETKKLHFDCLEISMRDEDIETFFSCPRNIHGLILHHCEDSTIKQLNLIAQNATVSYLYIIGGFPDFEEAGGLFASLQNLKTIEITYNSHFFNVHTPSAVFLSKIDIMKSKKMRSWLDEENMWQISPNFVFWVQNAHNLEGLHLPDKATDEVLQVIIRNCSKLEEFYTYKSQFTEDGLLGTAGGDSLCISELKELETLSLEMPNSFTDRTLIEAIRFSKLNVLILSGGKDLTLGGLQALANNCPMLETIRFEQCSFVPNCVLDELLDIFNSANIIKFIDCFIGVLSIGRATLKRHPENDGDDSD